MSKKIAAVGCLIMFLAPFLILGIGTFTYSVFGLLQGLTTVYWEPTTATINECSILNSEDSESYSQEVIISYTYMFAGKTYIGTRISIGYTLNNVEDHSELFEKLKNAEKILVYVNPYNPSKAVIVRGMNNSTFFLFLFSIMWNSLLSVFIFPYYKWRKEKVNELLIEDSRPSSD